MKDVRAGCDGCDWTGYSARAAKRHHEETGHTTWAETRTTTFYGDPIEQWAERVGMTVEARPNPPGGTER